MKRTILIVDDNEVNRKYANTVLSGKDTELLNARNAYEALEILKTDSPDVILMDIQMPEIDGFECLRLIRNRFPDCRSIIFAQTAFSNEYEKGYFTSVGFDDLIIKPIKPEVLKNKIDLWLKKNESDNLSTDSKQAFSSDFFNKKTYQDLQRFATYHDLLSIYKDFEAETKTFIENIKSYISSKDYEEILSILHTIKGNSASLGLDSLAIHTEQMETELKESGSLQDGRIESLTSLFGEFADNYERFLKSE